MRSGLATLYLISFAFFWGCGDSQIQKTGLHPKFDLKVSCTSSRIGPSYNNPTPLKAVALDGEHLVYLDVGQSVAAGEAYNLNYYNIDLDETISLVSLSAGSVMVQMKLKFPYLYYVASEQIAGSPYLTVNRYDIQKKLKAPNTILVPKRLDFVPAQGLSSERLYESQIDLFPSSENYFTWRKTKLFDDNILNYSFSICRIEDCENTIRTVHQFSAEQITVADARDLENIVLVGDFQDGPALVYSRVSELPFNYTIEIKRLSRPVSEPAISYSFSDQNLVSSAGNRLGGARIKNNKINVQAIQLSTETLVNATEITGSHRIYEIGEDEIKFEEILSTVSQVIASPTSRSLTYDVRTTEAADFSNRAHPVSDEISLFGFADFQLNASTTGGATPVFAGDFHSTYEVSAIQTTENGTVVSSQRFSIQELSADVPIGPSLPIIPTVSGVSISGENIIFSKILGGGLHQIRIIKCSVE